MLTHLKALKKYSIRAKDGEIGSIVDFYFDDKEWIIRYFVLDTGTWLPGRRVLLSPSVFHVRDETPNELQTFLTKEQIKKSPPRDSQKTVLRQHEIELSQYYGWQPYWPSFPGIPPLSASPNELRAERKEKRANAESPADPALKSFEEVKGYYIEALDGTMGHVSDFILGTKQWVIRYLIVDTRNWLPGRKALISPEWIQGTGWEESRFYVSLEKEEIRKSPRYDPEKSLERNYEEALHNFYGRRKYWEKDPDLRKSA